MNDYPAAGGSPDDAPERAVRKNLMLAATIEGGGMSLPVRIRNLSATGAMIDGANVPRAGARFTLRRLSLAVSAEAMWTEAGRCGVRFASEVEIDEWVAGARRGGAVNLSQSHVDQVQAAVRRAEPGLAQAAPLAPSRPAAARDSDRLIAQELLLVKHMLDRVSAELSEDVEVLRRHERALQQWEIAGAVLAILAKVMTAEDRAAAIARIEMHEVRSRLTGRPTLT